MRRYGLVDIPDQASDIDAVPITRTITIDGTTYDLSADRVYTTGAASNIYNSNGTLTGNRTLTQSTFSLTFAGTTSSRFHSNGNVSIGTTTDIGQKFCVLGQAVFGDFVTGLTGVIAYRSAITTRLGIFNGPILHSNIADVTLNIDTGGSNGAGSQPVRIYTQPISPVTTQFPLCLQGNGYETIFGQDTITTNASSLVTMVSTTKGFLPPRMTSAQRTAIGSPATGLIVYQTDGSAGLYVRNAAAWQLLGSGGGGGSGTVTSVSVVSANGFAGTVANETTIPAITLSTTVTGLLKGNGTAISAATAGTDYQAPITLTTTGTTGAATFASNTLNIPQYQGKLTLTTSGTSGAATLVGNTLNIPNYTSSGGTTQGVYTPTLGTTSNCTSFVIPQMQYFTVGNMVHVSGRITFTPTTTTNTFSFYLSVPVNQDFTGADYLCGGTCVRFLPSTTAAVSAGSIQGGGVNQVLFYFAVQNNATIADWYFTFSYLVTGSPL